MTVRHAKLSDAPAISRVHTQSWKDTYTGLMPEEFLNSRTPEKAEEHCLHILKNLKPRGAALVLEVEGVIAGLVYCGEQRDAVEGFDGEVYAIYVDKKFHGRGLGRELLRGAAGFLLSAGFKSLVIWVLTENKSRGFYEKMDGVLLPRRKTGTFGGRELTEVAYGWKDLLAIAGPPPLQ